MARSPVERVRFGVSASGRRRVIYKKGNFGFRKTLRALDEGERGEIKVAMTRWAHAIRDGAKARVRVLTGRLRNAIEARVARDGLSAMIGVFRSSIRAGVKHHNAEEFGTRHHSGQAYLWPATEEVRAGGLAGVKAAIRRVLRRAG